MFRFLFMDYRYFYIFWASIYFIIWILFYIMRSDLRTKMLIISISTWFIGIATEYAHIMDWWQPLTLTGTKIGFEDFFIGFSLWWVAAVIYEVIFQRKLLPISLNISPWKNRNGHIFRWIFLWTFLLLFFVFHLNSFYSIMTPCLLGIILMGIFRKDLIPAVFTTGGLMLILSSIIYYWLFIIYPGYIQEFWYLWEEWFVQLYLWVPLGEYIWFFMTWAVIWPLYNFTEWLRLVSTK